MSSSQRKAEKERQLEAFAAQMKARGEKRPRNPDASSGRADGKNKMEKRSLLDERAELLAAGAQVTLSKEEEAANEETNILTSIDNGFKPLMSVKELATGVTYSDSMSTTWRPPPHMRTHRPPRGTAGLRHT